ncbi:MAG: NADH-ubiquinone oxidoreductase-F iron-sulfur binding region domain-containing protein [Gammaproteobacteria bacterium]|nr:MAG: NADH-ubiquinone oxidoreductase-F iron-sulfur binding region domain-containing protein [Gammaproteobacteria bacterium]
MKQGTRIQKHSHPGAGRGRTRAHPKGRQVDVDALEQIQALLGKQPCQRDLLIEYLHLIQDNYGYLSEAQLAALAHEMRLPLAEVYEVASFYAHFDIVKEGETAPPEITVRVCDSLSCEMMGAQTLLARLTEELGAGVRVLRAPCMGRCDTAPVAEVGHRHVDHASVENVREAVLGNHVHPHIPRYNDYDAYIADGGYKLLRACREGERSVDNVIEIMESSALRGLGGAGFPTGRKWRIVRGNPRPRLLTVNADEGEPGTFKDRHYLERDPHRFLEGMLIAAWIVEAEALYIYLRDEYPAIREILLKEIAKLQAAGLMSGTAVHLRRGAGAYICGEESAMIESIEGKRGLPRHRPPYVAEVGLFGRPTLVQNVETLYWVREIIERGPQWFACHGRNGGKGLRSYSVSGRVRQPGVKLAPAGITARQLIDEYCGGMQEGHSFKAYLPGGASGGILPASLGGLPLEFGSLEKYGCFVGSHAVVILSDHDNTRDVALNLMRFFEDESCGQCTPCRIGTEKAVGLMQQRTWDENLLHELAQIMSDASICGLGQAAANPLRCVLQHFREDWT